MDEMEKCDTRCVVMKLGETLVKLVVILKLGQHTRTIY